MHTIPGKRGVGLDGNDVRRLVQAQSVRGYRVEWRTDEKESLKDCEQMRLDQCSCLCLGNRVHRCLKESQISSIHYRGQE